MPAFDAAATLPRLAGSLLGRIADAPTLAALWDLDRKLALLYSDWLRWQQAQTAYQSVLNSVMSRVQQAYASRLATAVAGVEGRAVTWRAAAAAIGWPTHSSATWCSTPAT